MMNQPAIHFEEGNQSKASRRQLGTKHTCESMIGPASDWLKNFQYPIALEPRICFVKALIASRSKGPGVLYPPARKA